LVIQAIEQAPLHNFLGFEHSVDSQVLRQWLANCQTQAAIAGSQNNAKAQKEYEQKLSKLAAVISEICEAEIEFSMQLSPLDVCVKMQGVSVGLDGLPDGLKSLIAWMGDLISRMDRVEWEHPETPLLEQPLILFLDEIDIHLHPKWQRRVLPVVQKLFPNAQIFVSTHSPFVVASVEDAWVYEMSQGEKNADGSFVIRAEKSGAGKSYELVLAETFDITEPFVDPETNRLLDAMRSERDALFADISRNPTEFLRITGILADRSEQLGRIAGLERRQLAKHGIDLTVANS
jgi:predicted ATP-binding protein involved in virulence